MCRYLKSLPTSASSTTNSLPHRIAAWHLPAVLVLALVLRVINLWGRPLWYDEAFAVLYAQKPFATILYGTVAQVSGAAADVHPVVYYGLLHLWMQVFGTTPVAVRSLSVLFGTASVGLVFLLGLQLGGRRLGLIAAAIAAVAPFAVYYSQEARMYALLGLAALGTANAFVAAWKRRRWVWWLAFGLGCALTLYAHNLGVAFVAAIDLWALAAGYFLAGQRWSRLKGWVASQVIAVALFAPWLTILPGQLGKIGQAYWVERPGLVQLVQTLLVFHFGYDNQALPAWLVPPALFLSILIPVMLGYQLIRWRFRPDDDGRTLLPPHAFLACLALVPVVFLFSVSQVRPVYVIRALLPAALAYYVLIATTLFDSRSPRGLRWLLAVPAGLIIVLSLVNHYTYTGFPRGPFRQVDAYLRQQLVLGDVIVHSNKLTFFPAHYYDPSLQQTFIADEPGSASDTLAYPTQQALGLYAEPDLETAVQGHERVWLVMFKREAEEYRAAGFEQHPQQLWLQQRYTLVSVQPFGDLQVLLYERLRSPGAQAPKHLLPVGSSKGVLL